MPDQPNLVFVFSDQQRSDSMSCYGNDWIQTPHLNALADNSFAFQRPYVTQAVCTPARASILTGLFPHTSGPIVNRIALPKTTPCLAEMVSSDYLCGYYGKWHLGNDSAPQHGFTVWHPTEDNKREMNDDPDLPLSPYYHHLIKHGFQPKSTGPDGSLIFGPDERSQLPAEFQMAPYLGDRAAEFIEENRDRPFVLFVSTYEPHPPYNGPFNDQYDPASIPVGPAFLEEPEGVSEFVSSRARYFLKYLRGADPSQDRYLPRETDLTTEMGWRKLRAQYFGNITLVDQMVGKITSALEKSGVADNTVVVFTSDHGEMAGDHEILEKRMFFEESAKVPLLIKVPWLSESPGIVPGNVSHIDLVPTLLDLLDQPIPGHLEGKSLLPVLHGQQTLEGNDVFIEWNGTGAIDDRNLGSTEINQASVNPWRSIVSGRWKLNLSAFDKCELFDLEDDPHELVNLFDDPSHEAVVSDLASRLRAWQARTGDTVPLPEN